MMETTNGKSFYRQLAKETWNSYGSSFESGDGADDSPLEFKKSVRDVKIALTEMSDYSRALLSFGVTEPIYFIWNSQKLMFDTTKRIVISTDPTSNYDFTKYFNSILEEQTAKSERSTRFPNIAALKEKIKQLLHRSA